MTCESPAAMPQSYLRSRRTALRPCESSLAIGPDCRIINPNVHSGVCQREGQPRFPHPALDEQINRDFIQSEIEGGVYLEQLPQGTELEIRTENRSYRILCCGGHHVLISGH